MKRLISIISAIFIITTVLLFYIIPPQNITSFKKGPYTITATNKDKKKIIIFSSRGGGGHISVTNALYEYLELDFCVGHTFIFANILGIVDPAQRLFNNKFSGEDWYNFLLKHKWHKLTNLIYSFGARYYTFRKKRVLELIENYLIKHSPDLIISVIPLINHLILKVAQKLDIPFLLIPTDLDATIAIHGIQKPNYSKFYIALAYQNEKILNTIKKADIAPHNVSYAGFPVKKAFFEPHNQRAIKKEFNIPDDKPIILLLMGAQGSSELIEFSKQLAKLTVPAHIIIVLGQSGHLRQSIRRIRFAKNVSHTILGFTDRIPDLMKASDLLITKSGSVSVNEAIYAQLPTLLDGTSTILHWEQFNHDFIKQSGLGDSIKRYHNIVPMVTNLLTNKPQYDSFKQNLASLDKKNPDQEIKLLVSQILSNER